jgi:hypothetical protein
MLHLVTREHIPGLAFNKAERVFLSFTDTTLCGLAIILPVQIIPSPGFLRLTGKKVL